MIVDVDLANSLKDSLLKPAVWVVFRVFPNWSTFSDKAVKTGRE